ncbi:helix-turn-helix domain-containing protein [Anaerovoracaceae bacterium HCP3S3_H6]
MTQAQLAQKLGVSDKSVFKWERRLRLLPRNT